MSPLLTRTQTLLLLGAFAAGMLLHTLAVPLWSTGIALGAIAWRWLHHAAGLALPGRWLRPAIALALFGAVFAQFRTLGGLVAGGTLLIAMGAAKLLETRAARDAVIVASVALILVLAAALDRQSLARLPVYLGTAWLALAAITALGSTRTARSAVRSLRTAGGTALVALPFALLCFVLVPRLPGALWPSPSAERARTGLSEEMSPGSITELARSDEIAFRVEFEGTPPPFGLRYWRGPVLHDFDGATWRRARGQTAIRQETQPDSAPLRYRVVLEPHQQNYLFALDTVAAIEGLPHTVQFDGQVRAARPVTSPVVYQAVSHLSVRHPGELSLLGRRIDTRLPEGRNPRTVALAGELRAASGGEADYARRVLDWLAGGGFEYSLAPPATGQESVDELLFRTKRGFCGHYASAYVTLMRAAGVPARVVTGYLGGTWNAVGGHYTVRQADAHAWAEVWLPGEGWTRIDPTAVVAPGRLTLGLDELWPERLSATGALFSRGRWLRDLRDTWEAAAGWWQLSVVNFNRAAQRGLFERIGLPDIDYGGMALLLAIGGALWAALTMLVSFRRPRRRLDPLARLWERFIALLGRLGIAIAPHEGPEAIRRRARRLLPEAARQIDELAGGYARARFGPGPEDPRALRLLAARLSAIARATAARRRRRTAAAAPG